MLQQHALLGVMIGPTQEATEIEDQAAPPGIVNNSDLLEKDAEPVNALNLLTHSLSLYSLSSCLTPHIG